MQFTNLRPIVLGFVTGLTGSFRVMPISVIWDQLFFFESSGMPTSDNTPGKVEDVSVSTAYGDVFVLSQKLCKQSKY